MRARRKAATRETSAFKDSEELKESERGAWLGSATDTESEEELALEGSHSEWEDGRESQPIKDGDVKNAIRDLTEGYSLTFKQIKDKAALNQAPLDQVPASKIKAMINYGRRHGKGLT